MTARQPTRSSAPFSIGAALSLALAAAVLAVPPARAADDDVPLDTKILRSMLESLGLERDGAAINYQERPPLVIPPNRSLPPPERSDAVIANNPAWPKDPDVQRAKAAKAAAAKNALISADAQVENEKRPLRPDEMTPGARPGMARTVGRDNREASTFSDRDQKMSPSQLGYSGSLWNTMFGHHDDDVARFTGEPARTSLTEPPAGYQTPSPDQPYGLTAKTKAPKATNYLLEHGTAETMK